MSYIEAPLLDVGAIAKSECDGIMMRGRSGDDLLPTNYDLVVRVSDQRPGANSNPPATIKGKMPADMIYAGNLICGLYAHEMTFLSAQERETPKHINLQAEDQRLEVVSKTFSRVAFQGL